MKTFPKLTQTTVRLGIGDGRSINVPMLPLSKLGELKSISADLGKCEAAADFNAVHERMLDLARTVMPQDLCQQLPRLDIPKLSELLGYLAYGDPDGDDLPDDPAKKN